MSDSPFGIKHKGGDCYATWYAQKKAAELAGKYGFAADEDEDLAQDLALHLLCQWPQYDPSKGKPTTFIQNVIDTKVCQLIRDQCDPKRDFRRLRSLSDGDEAAEYGLFDGVRGQPELSDQDSFELQSDFADITARLPEELRQIADLLKTKCPHAVAQEFGIPESTVRKRIGELREYFEQAGYGDA
ncbi:MAG: sigma factor [Planctomycetaceae bacterium]|nr:sigma-70 family RNA polymerase sigma factor [Planctomycetaceae bacterium]